MRNLLFLSFSLCLLFSCNGNIEESKQSTSIGFTKSVSDHEALLNALTNAEPGDNIVMTNGEWNDIEIKISKNGTEDKPIRLLAETPGKVFIQGESNLELGGDYIIVEGLSFVNGYSPSQAVIKFAIEDEVANHCKVRNCLIKDYNKLQKNFQDLWVLFMGRNNQLDHCYLAGKSNRGPTIRVDLKGNQSINNYHKITNNHFGPRPPKGGPSAETIQIGDSYTSMCPSYTLVANNYFDECNGEVEVISSKTNFNEFRNNVFYKSEGSLVTRHGNYCTVDGNYFIGSDESSNYGGVRLIGTGHNVTNNYFYKLSGSEFRSPLAVMNGIRKSPLNRYIQVTDVTVAHNTYIDCKSPLQFGVGSNVAQKDVLPASEIRSERPIRTVVANNLIYNRTGDKTPIVAHDKLDGIQFESNVIQNQGVQLDTIGGGMKEVSFELNEITEKILIPTTNFPEVDVFNGFGFEAFDKGIFGGSRSDQNSVGAIVGSPLNVPNIFDTSQYGVDWELEESNKKGKTNHMISSAESLIKLIAVSNPGDVLQLSAGEYVMTEPIKIDKPVTIVQSFNETEPATIIYDGPAGTPLFEMHPKGELALNNITLQGKGSQYAFAPLKENMSSLYNLKLKRCDVENFDYILKAYKYSFSEHIDLYDSNFSNCKNGLELSEETEDKGEYNAENISISDCSFENIGANVVDYYRGGYDESTVGGNLNVINSRFTNCGAKEKNKILLNTYGIINVNLSGNFFTNNPVKLIAQLWGAKNNKHANNKIVNSGKILVEENLKLKTFY